MQLENRNLNATIVVIFCRYDIPNVQCHGVCLKTNHGSNTATRGFGKPQSSAIIESILDHGATATGLDANILRGKNIYCEGSKTMTGTPVTENLAKDCYDRVMHKVCTVDRT